MLSGRTVVKISRLAYKYQKMCRGGGISNIKEF